MIRGWRAGLWAVLAVFVLASVSGGALAQKKPAKGKVPQLKSKLSSVRSKKKVVQGKLKKVKVEVWYAAADLQQTNKRIKTVEANLAATRSKLSASKKRQAKLGRELDLAHAKLVAKKKVVARRIRSIYVSGQNTVLSVLIGASNVADFASRKHLLERIAKRDQELFDELKTIRDEIQVKKRKQDAVVNEVAQLKARQQMQEAELRRAQSEKASVLSQLRQKRAGLEEQLEAMERESSRIEAQIRAFQLANLGRVPAHRGIFLVPVNGRFSSPYGYRTHPISGSHKLHTGQDIAAPYGTTIRAAGSGVVIAASTRGGYGKTVLIDHGGGISTLYGHCSSFIARPGQRVSAGDPIARVGSTGYSTGNHLHFEVRVNGSPVNPRRYIGR